MTTPLTDIGGRATLLPATARDAQATLLQATARDAQATPMAGRRIGGAA